MTAPSPQLSVVVVNWNSRDHLADCLRSLSAQGADLELIVVDNGSHDGSAEMVRSEYPWATLLGETKNLGFAAGCNRGIVRASSEWVCMLNNDAVAEAGWAGALVRAAREAPSDCGMLQSLMLYRDRPGRVNSTGIEILWNGAGRDRGDARLREECGEPAEIFCPTAGAGAYRRSMLEAVRLRCGDYFDAEHFLYYEDLDLGWRARLAGWSARYVPDAVVHHVYHGSTRRHPTPWLDALVEMNRIRTLIKNASPFLIGRAAPQAVKRTLRRRHSHHDGAPEGARHTMIGALGSAWRLRSEVEAMRRVARRALESRWVVEVP